LVVKTERKKKITRFDEGPREKVRAVGGFGRQHLLYSMENRSGAQGKQQAGGALGTRIRGGGKFGYPEILRTKLAEDFRRFRNEVMDSHRRLPLPANIFAG
jgi:hypothetical protein